MFQLKLWKLEEDDQLILSILSNVGAYYSVFVSTFHSMKLSTPNWKMPTLDAFICLNIVTSKNILYVFFVVPDVPTGRITCISLYPMFLIERTNKHHEEVPSIVSQVISTPVVVTQSYMIKLGLLKPT